MLKITIATKTQSNGTVPANSVMEFDPYFKTDRVKQSDGKYKEVTRIIYKNETWNKAADYQDGTTPCIDKGVKEYGGTYSHTLTDQQMAELESGTGEFENVFVGVQNIIIKALENGYGKYSGVGVGKVIYYKAIMK